MTTKLRFLSNVWMACLVGGLALAGCGDDGGSNDGGGTDGTDGTGADTGTSNDSQSSSPTDPSAGTDQPGTMTAATETASDSEPGTTGDPPEPMPNGGSCLENEECQSGMCFVVGLFGGICGECLTDDDCSEGGCSLPNPLATPPQGATCNQGEEGAGCMSDEVCQDPFVCALILDVPSVLSASTCSQCADDSGCSDGQLCTPVYDIANVSGQKNCVDPGTVPDGGGCDLDGSGEDACANHCVEVDVMNFFQLGVCNECASDDDCNGGTCTLPTVDINQGLIPGGCA